MQKAGNKVNKIKLPRINLKEHENVAIFGTGDVALRYFNNIAHEYGVGRIDFFINSRVDGGILNGKEVLKPSRIPIETLNSRKYILATFSNSESMKNSLLNLGVHESNIIELMKRSSLRYFIEKFHNIRTVAIYPTINNMEDLKRIINEIEFMIPFDKYNRGEFFISSDLKYFNENKFINIVSPKENKYAECDLVFVWDSSVLFNTELENMDNVICYDGRLLHNLNTRMLAALSNKLIDKSLTEKIKDISKKNYLDVIKLGAEKNKSYIFGSGPSIGDYLNSIQECALDDGVKMVCNQFHLSNRFMDIIKPDLYLVMDSLFFGDTELKESFKHIIKVVMESKCKLVVPQEYVRGIYAKYSFPKELLIGLKTSEFEYNVPTLDNMSVKITNNVVTCLALPIASAISDSIAIAGCDGRNDDFRWEHNDQLLGAETEYGKKHDIQKDERSLSEMYEEHCKCMEDAMLYGEKLNKRYFSLTRSYIPALSKRYYK